MTHELFPDEVGQSQIDPNDIVRYDEIDATDVVDQEEYKPDFFVDIVYDFGEIDKAIQKNGETSFSVTECRTKLLRLRPELQPYFGKNFTAGDAVVDVSFEVYRDMFSVTQFAIYPDEGPEIRYEFEIPDTYVCVNSERQEQPIQYFGNSVIGDALQMIIPANRHINSRDIARSLYDLGLVTSKLAIYTDGNITYEMKEKTTTSSALRELRITTFYPTDDVSIVVKHVAVITDRVSDDPLEPGTTLVIEETAGTPKVTDFGPEVDGDITLRVCATEDDIEIIRDAIEKLHDKTGPVDLS